MLDALVGADASAATRETFRKKLRAGELDDKEIEIEVQQTGAGMPMFEIPGMPGAQMGAIKIGDMFGKARRRPHQDARGVTVRESLRAPGQRGIRQAARSGRARARGGHARSRTTASSFSTRSTRSARRDGRIGGRRLPRGRAARPAAADRGHDASPPSTARSRPTTSCSSPRAPFTSPSPPTCCPSCRADCRSGSSSSRLSADDFRRILTEPEASLIKQYVALMATEGARLAVHRRRHRGDRRHRRRGQRQASRTSARAGCRR